MHADEARTVAEWVDSIDSRDALNIIDRAVTRARMRIADAERAALAADPEHQRRMAALETQWAAEDAERSRQWQNRQQARETRLASAPVLGTITLGRIRPKYLVGKTLPVIGVNEKTYKCNVPDDAAFRTWRNRQGIRVPKTCVAEFTPGATI